VNVCLLLCSSRESRADDHAPARLPLSTSPFLSVYATICTSRNFTASYRPYRIAGVRLHMRNSYQRFGRTCHDTFVSLFCYPDSTPGLTTGSSPCTSYNSDSRSRQLDASCSADERPPQEQCQHCLGKSWPVHCRGRGRLQPVSYSPQQRRRSRTWPMARGSSAVVAPGPAHGRLAASGASHCGFSRRQ